MSNFGTSKVQFLVTGIRLQEGTAGPSTLGLCALDDDGARAVHSFSGCAARVLSLQSTFFETLLVLAKILRGFVAARSRLCHDIRNRTCHYSIQKNGVENATHKHLY